MDQGTIQNLKVKSRIHRLHFLVNKTILQEDPVKQMDILQAIRWTIQAWREVEPVPIAKYWDKSSCLNYSLGPQLPTSEDREQALILTQQLHELHAIKNCEASLDDFLDPPMRSLLTLLTTLSSMLFPYTSLPTTTLRTMSPSLNNQLHTRKRQSSLRS